MDKRDEYLRGIAASAPEVKVNHSDATHSILEIAFDYLRNRDDWRGPIHATVTVHEKDAIGLGVYLDAVRYFTGTEPNAYIVEGFNPQTKKATYRIVSEGYRLGPAGA